MNKFFSFKVLFCVAIVGSQNFLSASQKSNMQFFNIRSSTSSSDSRSLVPSYEGNEKKYHYAGGGVCTLLIVGAIFGGVFGSATRTYVSNDSGQYCELRYPGCSRKDSDGKSHSVDCTKAMSNGDRTTIYHYGDLSRLYATDAWGFDRGDATNKALEGECHKFSIGRKNGHFSFSRDCGDGTDASNSNSTTSGMDIYQNETYFSDKSVDVKEFNNNTDIVSYYLRGSKK